MTSTIRLHRGSRAVLARIVLGVALLLTWIVGAAELSRTEARGKEIYVSGIGASGEEITAYVGPDAIPLPARSTPCANCHGADGTGRPESGVVPTDIRWSRLTKPYGASTGIGGRQYPAYDEEALKRAIVAGIDPADNELDPAMPRFFMADQDLSDLVAYLKHLETDLDPGVSEDAIVLGTVLPRPRGPGSIGRVMATVLEGYFDDVNAQGRVHNRRLELRVAYADNPEDALAQAERLVGEQRVFALVGAFTLGVEQEFASLAGNAGVPFVAPFTHSVVNGDGTDRFVFHVSSGTREQGRALVKFAADQFPDRDTKAAVVYSAQTEARGAAAAMIKQSEISDWTRIHAVDYPGGDMDPGRLARELRDAGTQALFFLGSGPEFRILATSADRIGWRPFVFLHGHLAGRDAIDAPAGFEGRIYAAFPTSLQDHSSAGRLEFNGFRRRHGLPTRFLAAQITSYTAAKLLVEGLSQAGRDLSREKLVLALEGLYRYTTGFTPPLTYGPNRHVGALGAHIVAADLANRRFFPESTWVELD